MQFAVTPSERDGDPVLRVSGELDIATVDILHAAVRHALDERPKTLLVDLTPTHFIDSTGCRELVLMAKTGRAGGVAVEVVAPPSNWRVRRVIDLVQLSDLITVHDELPGP